MTDKEKEFWEQFKSNGFEELKTYLTNIDLNYFQSIEYAEDQARKAPYDAEKAMKVILAKNQYMHVHKIVKHIFEILHCSI